MTPAGMHRPAIYLYGQQRILLGMLAWLCIAPANADVFTLDQLGKLLERDQASSVHYVERQYRKTFTVPVEQQGELHFIPPDQFEKQVTKPVNERYALAGETLTITRDNGKRRQLSVRNQPLLRGLLLSFQSVVSGRLSELTPLYQCELSGSADAWQLALRPKDAQLQRYVAGILVNGKQGEPLQFAVTETSGDRIVTEIQPQNRSGSSR